MSATELQTVAVLMREPQMLELSRLALSTPGDDDVIVDVAFSGISTGTERLLWSGEMPAFPGLGYPLVPGYETVGTVVEAGQSSKRRVGDHVYVPGARCFKGARGLFGGAAARLILPGEKTSVIDSSLGEHGVLLALAATAQHVLAGGAAPQLIIGHGVLGRLLARVAIANGAPPPRVWEVDPSRRENDGTYEVVDPSTDDANKYDVIIDASGDASVVDRAVARLARGGEIVLAGFYSERIEFDFPPAFMAEMRLRTAAEWTSSDLQHVIAAVEDGRLSLENLITHHALAAQADVAYRVAFSDPSCLKMVLDWREYA